MALPQLAKQMAQWQEMSAGMDQQQVTGWLAEIEKMILCYRIHFSPDQFVSSCLDLLYISLISC